MIKDITLGQFFPGNTVIHRLNPALKIILTVIYIAAVFIASNLYAFAFIVLSSIILVAVSGISYKTVLKSLKPLLFVIIFTTFFNVFWTKGDTLLISFWAIDIYLEGVVTALMTIIRVTALLIGTSVLLTYTTSPIMLTDALERLLSPLKIIKLPVHEFSMMMSIALRFIPTLIEETDKIMSAQKARGADFESGSLIKRAKALVPILIPLFISSFRRADELATAMECRCYRGGEGRTKMTKLKINGIDVIVAFVFVIFIASVILIGFIPCPISI